MGFHVFLFCDEGEPDVIKNPVIVDTVINYQYILRKKKS